MTTPTCGWWARNLVLFALVVRGFPAIPAAAQAGPVEPPSLRTRQLDLAGTFAATAPENWLVQQTPNGTIVVAPRNGYVATNRQTHFTHGLELVLLDSSSEDLLTEVDRVVTSFSQANPRLTQSDTFQRETIAGHPAVVTRLNNVDSQTNAQETIFLAITKLSDTQVLAMLCVSPASDAPVYEAPCRTVRQSLRPTTRLTEATPSTRPSGASSANAAPVAPPANHPLAGKWGGRRPTDGYVWDIRFEIEFLPDGTYAYTARQVSPQKRFWTLQHKGRFRYMPGDARGWDAVVELTPDQGSAAPPSDDDRVALFDILGLPDERVHKFRFRRSRVGLSSITIQPTDANSSDDITQTWSLTPPGGR